MSANGKNESERFTDKCGYNHIWDALKEWISSSVNELDIDGNDIALDDISIKFVRNLQVDNSRFAYDAIIEASARRSGILPRKSHAADALLWGTPKPSQYCGLFSQPHSMLRHKLYRL